MNNKFLTKTSTGMARSQDLLKCCDESLAQATNVISKASRRLSLCNKALVHTASVHKPSQKHTASVEEPRKWYYPLDI